MNRPPPLWRSRRRRPGHTQTGVIAGPISYAVDGEQYIAVLAGWGGGGPLTLGELANLSGTTAFLLLCVFTVVNVACLVLRRKPRRPPAFAHLTLSLGLRRAPESWRDYLYWDLSWDKS